MAKVTKTVQQAFLVVFFLVFGFLRDYKTETAYKKKYRLKPSV